MYLSVLSLIVLLFFFFMQKTAYEMRISDWSSDVCSSDLFASAMHAAILDDLFSVTGWKHPHAVFHGGTALKFRWESLRFSEDLDFMIAETSVVSLDEAMAKVRDMVDVQIGALYPGGIMGVARRDKGDGEVLRWDFRDRKSTRLNSSH